MKGVRNTLTKHHLKLVPFLPIEVAKDIQCECVFGAYCESGVIMSFSLKELREVCETSEVMVLPRPKFAFSASVTRNWKAFEWTSELSPRAITRGGRSEGWLVVLGNVVESFNVDEEKKRVAEKLFEALDELRKELGLREVHADGWETVDGTYVYDVDLS